MDSRTLAVVHGGRIILVRVWWAAWWFAREERPESGPTGKGDSEESAICNLLELTTAKEAGHL